MKCTLRYIVRVYEDYSVRRILKTPIPYHSARYNKDKTVDVGFDSDGATKAITPPGSASYWVHDAICKDPTWDDGTPITAWQAAMVLSDILAFEADRKREYQRWISATISKARSIYWLWLTLLFGCIKSRTNGWF